MIIAAILDSGLAPNRPEFPHLLPGHNFSLITRNPHWVKGMPTREFWMAPDPRDTADDYGHGTHVTGIVVANAQTPITILPVKISSANGQSTAGMIMDGMRFAIASGAKVINLSIGSAGVDDYEDIMLYAEHSGVVVVCAAGNNGSNELYYPGADPLCLSVGAVNHHGDRCGFSNHGAWVNCYGLGQSVNSTVPNYPCPIWSRSGRRILSGTSMAAPMVTAQVCDLIARNPGIKPAEVRGHLQGYSYKPVPVIPVPIPIIIPTTPTNPTLPIIPSIPTTSA